MNSLSVICLLVLYLRIKPPATFNVDKTDGTLSYFLKEIKTNLGNGGNFINVLFWTELD